MSTLNTQVDTILSKAAMKPEESMAVIDATINRLQTLKRKLKEIKEEEDMYIARTKARFLHLDVLSSIQTTDSEDYIRWSKTRLNRVLVDYMLRKGFVSTATKLSQDSNVEVMWFILDSFDSPIQSEMVNLTSSFEIVI